MDNQLKLSFSTLFINQLCIMEPKRKADCCWIFEWKDCTIQTRFEISEDDSMHCTFISDSMGCNCSAMAVNISIRSSNVTESGECCPRLVKIWNHLFIHSHKTLYCSSIHCLCAEEWHCYLHQLLRCLL